MAELDRQRICQRVREARREAGLTQEEMAELIGVRPRTYQNYERDRVPFRLLGRIAEVTGRDQEWFLRGRVATDEDRLGELEGLVAQGFEEIRQSLADLAELVEQQGHPRSAGVARARHRDS